MKTVWFPLLLVDRVAVIPFALVKASLPTVAEVAVSLTVQELLVTVGTVYDPKTVWFPLLLVLRVIVRPLAAVKANLPTVAEVTVSETVQDVAAGTVGTVYDANKV